jgi:hypothetical protein
MDCKSKKKHHDDENNVCSPELHELFLLASFLTSIISKSET